MPDLATDDEDCSTDEEDCAAFDEYCAALDNCAMAEEDCAMFDEELVSAVWICSALEESVELEEGSMIGVNCSRFLGKQI